MNKNISILIADEHEMLRVGLRSIFAEAAGLTCCGEATTTTEALHLVERLLPDVVIMDTQLPGGDAIDVCRTIRSKYPKVRVMMLTNNNNDEAQAASLLAGASGLVPKDVSGKQLVQSIRKVAAGGLSVDANFSNRLLQRIRSGKAATYDKPNILSQQQRHILVMIANGKTNKEIAHTLGLSEKTVRNYVSAILAKLKMNNRAEAAAYAVREKLLN